MAVAFSSSGPIFHHLHYASGYFDELTARLTAINSQYPLEATSIAKWLATKPSTFGGGISAMPSVHVAVGWLTFILFRDRFGLQWQTWVGFAYFALIWFGSVHLAWHYFTDGLVSIACVSALWWLTGCYVDALSRIDQNPVMN